MSHSDSRDYYRSKGYYSGSDYGKHQHHRERSRSRSPRRQETQRVAVTDSKSSSERSRPSVVTTKPVPKSIQLKLATQKPTSSPLKPKLSVASAFNEDSDDEPEEMPPEAKMRMRNIGRDTPTSSGPNSFGKTKHGFSDAKKLFEKNLKEAMDSALADD